MIDKYPLERILCFVSCFFSIYSSHYIVRCLKQKQETKREGERDLVAIMWIKRPNEFGKVFDAPTMRTPSKVLLFSFSSCPLPASVFLLCFSQLTKSVVSRLPPKCKCFIFCLYRLKYFTQQIHTAGRERRETMESGGEFEKYQQLHAKQALRRCVSW